MSTLAHPTIARPARQPHRLTTTTRYWIAAIIAIVGVVAGVGFGVNSYRDSQRHLDTFDRVSVPGEMTVQIGEPTGRVLYYEGDDNVRFDDLDIRVTGPTGSAVEVNRYEGEMIYETLDLTKGRAVATFNAVRAGTYRLQVTGVDTGQLTVGDSFSKRALPGVLTGIGIAGATLAAGFVLWLVTFIERPRTTERTS